MIKRKKERKRGITQSRIKKKKTEPYVIYSIEHDLETHSKRSHACEMNSNVENVGIVYRRKAIWR